LDVFCETEKEGPDLEVLYLSVSRFFVLKNPRHVFAETARSKWLEKYLARSVDRGPPFAASLFEFQPSTTPARRANISGQTKGVFTCVRFKSQNHCSYYSSQ